MVSGALGSIAMAETPLMGNLSVSGVHD